MVDIYTHHLTGPVRLISRIFAMSKETNTQNPSDSAGLHGDTDTLHAADKNIGVQHYEGGNDDEGLHKAEPSGELRITHDMTPEEKATILRLANEQDPGPDILSWTYLKFVLTCLVVILNSGDNGFDGTVMG